MKIILTDFTKENLSKADVAIEFTTPHTAYENIKESDQFRDTCCQRLYRLDRPIDEIKDYCTGIMEHFYTQIISALGSIFSLR